MTEENTIYIQNRSKCMLLYNLDEIINTENEIVPINNEPDVLSQEVVLLSENSEDEDLKPCEIISIHLPMDGQRIKTKVQFTC